MTEESGTARVLGHPVTVSGPTRPLAVIEPPRGVDLDWRSVWQYRELLYFLVWRNLKVRYKQTAVGAAWAIVQPLLSMLIFTVIFGLFVRVPSDGVPYSLFAYAALTPWTYFAQALARTSGSLVGDTNLLTKVYFPRLIIPLAAVITPLADFGLTFLTLLGLMAWFGVAPGANVLLLPLFVMLAVATALAVGLWLSALNVKYRDVAHTTPFLIQVWMYASPIVYPTSLVPEKWQFLYGINPMAGVIEGFRWTLLGTRAPALPVVTAGTIGVVLLLAGGLVYFKRMETTFPDVI